MENLKKRARAELTGNILPFWQGMIDRENGGFFGFADFYGRIDKTAPKGGILNSRILWAFSAAARVTGDAGYLPYAEAAFDFLESAFYDGEYGGLFWEVDCRGGVISDKKQFYNLAFGLYGLSEYARAGGVKKALALTLANSLFDVLETHAYDKKRGGYFDAAARDYKPLEDSSLSAKDFNCAKSMNTNLHVLEAYTNFARISERPKEPLRGLIEVTIDKIIEDGKRFRLFFDEDFKPLSRKISYGHDIEGAWLLREAVEVLGDKSLLARARETAASMAAEVYENGRDTERGGLFNEREENGEICAAKAWWPQAEAVVGFCEAHSLTGDEKYLKAATEIFDYIDRVFIDKERGEWHNEVDRDGAPDVNMEKAGFWKCPYHNGRMCLEIIERG